MNTEKIKDIAQKLNEQEQPSCYIGMKKQVEHAYEHILAAMYPCHYSTEDYEIVGDISEYHIKEGYKELKDALCHLMMENEAEDIASVMIEKLPQIKEILNTDILAGYQGDPAAVSTDEIILSYPAFIAISAYRIAHELYLLHIPFIPRMLTEYAHRLTGIDIHPGATIGEHFFIDHGTGVVIGETAVLGHHVKLYQHVTLGAKSFEVNEDGSLVKGIKRHPNIGNHVVIYAGATILGGTTYIGDHCVIGGNVWLTHSVEAYQTVLANKQ